MSAQRERWRQWPDIADIFDGPADANWAEDRDLAHQGAGDPFAE